MLISYDTICVCTFKNPLDAQTQCAGMEYTTVLRKEKSMYADNFVRSAIAPDTMVVAVVANDN